MNILQSKQTQEPQETICQTHKMEYIAVDLDMSNRSSIKLFCGKCLVDKLKNMKVTTIEQSKEIILQLSIQQKDVKKKEIQARLEFYKSILDKIMNFKRSIEDTLDKIYRQLQQQFFSIQREKQESQELQEYQQQLNYFEDIKQLQELDRHNSYKLKQDNIFIDQIKTQFELLFNNAEYFQALDTFKNTQQIIQDLIENNVIQLPPLLLAKDQTKTPSLDRICNNHNKEIIMIDMDSQKKQIEDRFVCVECISQNPQIKYQTIEYVNKQWMDYNLQHEKMLFEFKKENQDKKSKLFNQLSNMRKNYNQKLNEISEKLMAEQQQSFNRSKEFNQFNRVSLLALEDENMLRSLSKLVEKEKLPQNQQLINLKNQEAIFRKELEYSLEVLREQDQLDIQQSLDVLNELPMERNLISQLSEVISQFSMIALEKVQSNENQIEIIKDVQELIEQAKKYQCQIKIFDQTIQFYQLHCNKIDQIQQKILNQTKNQGNQSELINSQYQIILKTLNDYIITIDNKRKKITQYSDIKIVESDLVKLKDLNKVLEIEKTNLLKSQDQKQQENHEALTKYKEQNEQLIKDITQKLQDKEKENLLIKELVDEKNQEIINLKKQNKEDIKKIKELEDKRQIEIEEINNRIDQKESELQKAQRQLDQINQEKQKEEIEKSNQYQKGLQFSNTYKHSNYSVGDSGKVVECGNGGYCLCEQEIANNEKILFALQILDISKYVMIGIGFRDTIQKNNYCYIGVGYGSYLIRDNGFVHSHHNKDLDNKQLSFTFSTNDIIIIEVSIEHKYIKWSKYNNPQSIYQMQIETSISSKLYPCMCINNSKIKILDQIPT